MGKNFKHLNLHVLDKDQNTLIEQSSYGVHSRCMRIIISLRNSD